MHPACAQGESKKSATAEQFFFVYDSLVRSGGHISGGQAMRVLPARLCRVNLLFQELAP